MPQKHRDKNKVTIFGAGFVGSTIAFSLLHRNVAEEIALVDLNKNLVASQAMDLQNAVPVLGYSEVKVGSLKDVKDSTVAVIACGCNQKPGETRLDLLQKNACIIKTLVPQIFKTNPNIILVMITNPVDILTKIAVDLLPAKKKQIIGSGTLLDSLRLRFLVGEYLNVNPQSVHVNIVGEHGDSSLPLWSAATVGGEKIINLKKFKKSVFDKLFLKARNEAYMIIKGKQATYYGIGAGAAFLIDAVIMNKRTVLPVSHFINGEYGLRDVCLSLPAVVGETGIMETVALDIGLVEKKELLKSAHKLQTALKNLAKKTQKQK